MDVGAEGKAFRMFLSDISESGVFIRTNKGLPPGTAVDLKLYLPDESIAFAKGWVRRTTKTKVCAFKNGMGIQLTGADEHFKRFFEAEFCAPFTATPIRKIIPSSSTLSQQHISEKRSERPNSKGPENNSSTTDDFIIVRCGGCNVKNRVLRKKIALHPKCGKCGTVLQI